MALHQPAPPAGLRLLANRDVVCLNRASQLVNLLQESRSLLPIAKHNLLLAYLVLLDGLQQLHWGTVACQLPHRPDWLQFALFLWREWCLLLLRCKFVSFAVSLAMPATAATPLLAVCTHY